MPRDLSFLEPSRLWLLLIPVLLVAGYVVVQLTRRRYAVRFTNVALLDEVAPDRPGWRRHLPAAVLVLGVIAATLGFAKPAVADVDDERSGVVILAIDTSLSMEATDVAPSRFKAAKEAAKVFLDNVPEGVRIGVVGFDGQARQLLAPTDNTDAVARTIDRLQLGEGTAIGEAVATSLGTISDTLEQDTETTTTTAGADEQAPATVVLLSDGETTVGRPNDEAAALAEEQGVPVHTIAFGTDRGSVTAPDGQQVPVPVNRQALQRLANQTSGQYFPAATADQLKQVYEQLGRSAVAGDVIHREVGDWFIGIALVLVALAAAGSLFWFSRLP
jgi:Ca-activated chloride channel family protein